MFESVPRKVLVIDNEPDSAAKLKTFLNYLGCTVKIAQNGYTALQSVREFKPDTVICSTGLPRMNGFQVARELRHDPATAAIRLIAIVDFRASTLEDLDDSSDFDVHLFKPITLVKLRGALATGEQASRPGYAGMHASRLRVIGNGGK